MSMAIQAPAHRHRLFLPGQGHLVDPPVTRHAAHALLNVNCVVEVDEVRQIVHPGPDQWFVLGQARPHRLEHRARRPDLRVARHAGMGRRQTRKRRRLDRRVAIAAVDPQAAHVVLVREGHRLGANDVHLSLDTATEESRSSETPARARPRRRRRSSAATRCWHWDERSAAFNQLAIAPSATGGTPAGRFRPSSISTDYADFNTHARFPWDYSRLVGRSPTVEA